jgi:hypothetical protein
MLFLSAAIHCKVRSVLTCQKLSNQYPTSGVLPIEVWNASHLLWGLGGSAGCWHPPCSAPPRHAPPDGLCTPSGLSPTWNSNWGKNRSTGPNAKEVEASTRLQCSEKKEGITTELYTVEVYTLFNDAVSSSECVVSNERMIINSRLENIYARKRSLPNLRKLPCVCVEELRKCTKNPRSGWPVNEPRFVPRTSPVWSRSA